MFESLRLLARATPPSRERVIDLLRAIAIIAVILGHWLVSVIEYDQGQLVGRSALPYLPWAHPLTWILQVMPLFFFAGGCANAVSLSHHRQRGGTIAEWLGRRGERLIKPTTALVVTMIVASVFSAHVLHIDPTLVRRAVWAASIPLWFLAVYLLMVGLTPLAYGLYRRYGVAMLAVLIGLVALGDIARLYGDKQWGYGSFLFGWLAVYLMGFAWRDGRILDRGGVGVGLLLGGLIALPLLTLVGPYPVSMIDIPGERIHNMSPPSLALLAVASVQIGLVLLLRDRIARWLQRDGPWMLVIAVNRVVLTIFLWHMAAAVVVAGALHGLGILPTPEAGSAEWLAWRLPALVALSTALAGLVTIFGRIETRQTQQWRATQWRWSPSRLAEHPRMARWIHTRTSSRFALVLTLTGFTAVVYSLVTNALWPSTSPTFLGLPPESVISYLCGASLLWLLRILQRSSHV